MPTLMRFSLKLIGIMLFALLFNSRKAFGYSVLTHEAIVDAAWDISIKPYLLFRYPHATENDLVKARAFAYGGALAPDMGYYPRGSKFFTNLVHYVRSGDFVQALIDSASNLNELAFAVGAVSHYAADCWGHPLGTNRSAPVIYPEVRKKFGSEVSYEDDPLSHIRTEFGFDVLQTARGIYASNSFHDFIGFQVSKELLAKAFLKTYGLQIDDVFVNFDRSVNTFRWCVKELFPLISKTAWATRKAAIRKAKPGITARKFKYRMDRRIYNHDFEKKDRPGIGTTLLSFFIRIVPKIGKLKVLKFKVPGAVAEKLFVQSFDTAVINYSKIIQSLKMNKSMLYNVNYDTGEKIMAGDYKLTDQSYQCLLNNLQKDKFQFVDNSIKGDINTFFSEMSEPKRIPYAPALKALWAGVPFQE